MPKIAVETEYLIPNLPSFIVLTDGKSIPIQNINKTELLKIGSQWTDALIREAQAKKNLALKTSPLPSTLGHYDRKEEYK